MKSKYTKPLLAMELFSLTQTIARDCNTSYPATSFTLNDPNVCVLDINGMYIFMKDSNCVIDGEAMDFGCYHNPDGENIIFRS